MEKSIDFNLLQPNIKDAKNLQALTLAYIGDSIYDIMSREYIMKYHLGKINDLHKKTSTLVSAKAQAVFMEHLLATNFLTSEELAVYSRAKNQKNNSKAKNASIMEYKLATGLEAVFGYLYLEKNFIRLEEMFKNIVIYYEKTK